jgi:hypothetical protein
MYSFLQKVLLGILLLSANNLFAQTFGFGCLGLSGFYAGFSEYRFETPALNEFASPTIVIGNQTFSEKIKFGMPSGYRVGANIFRAKWDRFFISAKGFYQFLREENILTMPAGNDEFTFNYELNMNHWGVGIDFGVPLFWILDWKIIEGNVAFYKVEFNKQLFTGTKLIEETKFTTDKIKVGYFLGTGLILHIVPDYISLEGTLGFNLLELENLESENGSIIPITNSSKKMFEKGIWSATVQLNVGVPF